ncbi:MAG TPA: patatin-like phospholipase family protein [Methylomirabilota bacterium]|nr:patatin-like phospholipase family protein [Methylomirabilota bacterium]
MPACAPTAWLCALALLGLGLAAASAAASACAPSVRPLDAPTALVLSGGGAKGAYEAGVAAVFVERGLPIRLVAGSSAGALNAAMIADGRMERLEALWRSLSRDRVYSLRAPVFFAGLLPGWLTLLALDRAGSLFDPRPLRELIDASLDLDRIRASPVRLLVITSDLVRREPRLFDNRTITREALMAAAAVPGAFPAVDVAGTLLVDGGLTGRAPVLEALAAEPGVSRAVVVMSYAPEERGAPPTTMRRALEEAFEMGMIHQIRRDVELARFKFPGVEVHLLQPSAPLALRPLDFDQEGIARALERGRADAFACLSGWATR